MISNQAFITLLNFSMIFLLFNQFMSQTKPSMATSGNETDLHSLISIRDGIGSGLSSWNQSFHFCQWQGITCGKRHKRVISLNLSNQSLAGSLSPHVGNLSFLRVINLQQNKLYGEIPQEIGRLFRLQVLDLWDNIFEGEIPVNLTQCTELRSIDLSWNKLSRNIPAELGSLSKLVLLVTEKNNLTGVLPPSLGNLSSLQSFYTRENKLAGNIPASFSRLSSLIYFDVAVNRLSGEVPLTIFNISSLNRLQIAINQFSGSLPQDMGSTLPNLVDFLGSGNQLSGQLPVSLANASKLQNFAISTNNFKGQVPKDFQFSQTIETINFEKNYLGTGEAHDLSFIAYLTNSSNLQSLALDQNNFGGVFPNSITNLSNQMEKLYLGGNHISGIIPEGIGNLVNLFVLGLDSNNFYSSIPSSVGKLRSLQGLALSENKLSGPIPSSLANNTKLSLLLLGSNRLEGNIPSGLGTLSQLQDMELKQNNLNGTLHKEIFNMTSLLQFDFSLNYLTGSLPLEVGKLKNLGTMDASGNKLSGFLPSTLGDCLSLAKLILSENLFEGTVSQSFSSLENLQELDLSSNNLSGEIPKYWEDFPYLQLLNLSFNKFEGEVPVNGIFKSASNFSVVRNSDICGGIHELQLPPCRVNKTGKQDGKKQRRSDPSKIAIMISVAVFILLASCSLIFYLRRKSKLKTTSLPSFSKQHVKVSYADLSQATGGFSPTNFVGSGGFGSVYKGMLNQYKIVVAVKVFKLQLKGASKSFTAECESLRNIRHRNLVKILTSCSSMDYEGNEFKALVFEFMPNGSLDKWLHQEISEQDEESNLNLLQRLNVAIDVASALSYLHHECHALVIHRDLKPSNVLLDNDMVAHVGDFGLAKLLSGSIENLHDNQSTSIGVKGSIGYAAPEYGMGADASRQGDVYSYGILVLEMSTGRRPTDEMFKDGLCLHNYASNGLHDQFIKIIDPILLSEGDDTLGDTYNSMKIGNHRRAKLLECLTTIVRIGVACSVESPSERMDIKDVSKELQASRDTFLGTRFTENVTDSKDGLIESL